jgi:hypothetical protein
MVSRSWRSQTRRTPAGDTVSPRFFSSLAIGRMLAVQWPAQQSHPRRPAALASFSTGFLRLISCMPEGEAGDAVGRDYYEHGAQPGQGYRNGYRTGRLKTAEGLMKYSAPQITGRDEPFRSATPVKL